MSDIAIKVEGLSKLYKIGKLQRRHDTLRDRIADARLFNLFKRRNGNKGELRSSNFELRNDEPNDPQCHSDSSNPQSAIRNSRLSPSSSNNSKSAIRNSQSEDTLWALKDVSFEIKRGEVVGIIGRNGAGKSTLLKILSRITEPTEGYADINGRVGSLLEVGTGFHSELTGRENIYLNGSILGMKRVEIEKRFDEIVAFAEVDKFIDTPVKHYSSGMYLRLAFAVAAHLDPEILLVDEVLAVGDAEFQKKCLGKMRDVAGEGRTVLFVSHNMAAIRNLCSAVHMLSDSHVMKSGDPSDVIDAYLTASSEKPDELSTCLDHVARSGDGRVVIKSFTAASFCDGELVKPRTGLPLRLRLEYSSIKNVTIKSMLIAINIRDSYGQIITSLGNRYSGDRLVDLTNQGSIICEIPRLQLMPGRYVVDLVCRVNDALSDKVQDAAMFRVYESARFGTSGLPESALARVVFDYSICAAPVEEKSIQKQRAI